MRGCPDRCSCAATWKGQAAADRVASQTRYTARRATELLVPGEVTHTGHQPKNIAHMSH